MTRNQAFEILQHAGGIRAARIITDNFKTLSDRQIRKIAQQLQNGLPVAKIIHQKWFFGLKFYTNKYTLDPRPDTETLVAAVIADCDKNCTPRILDLGTGTGCIISALIKNIYGATGVGIDKSWRASWVAKKNIRNLKLKKSIKICRCDFFKKNNQLKNFDIIVSNPPYIAYDDNRVDDGAQHDPKMALFASDNGLAAYKAIAINAKNWLKDNGKIYMEIGQGQLESVKQIFIDNGWRFLRCESDLGGIERVLVFTKV